MAFFVVYNGWGVNKPAVNIIIRGRLLNKRQDRNPALTNNILKNHFIYGKPGGMDWRGLAENSR